VKTDIRNNILKFRPFKPCAKFSVPTPPPSKKSVFAFILKQEAYSEKKFLIRKGSHKILLMNVFTGCSESEMVPQLDGTWFTFI